MDKLTFFLSTESALFMHGVESQNSAELRAPSFKGLLRFWYRALYGSFYSLPELKREEAATWGSRDLPSPVRVRIAPGRPRLSPGNLLPHKETEKAEMRGSIGAGHNFQLSLEVYPWSEAVSLERLAWPCWFAFMLGGFGNRARRGAGSIRLASVKPEIAGMPDLSGCTTPEVLVGRLSSGFQAAKEFARKSAAGNPGDGAEASFPVLFHPASPARIVAAALPAQDETAARTAVMMLLREYKDPFFGLPLRLEDKLIRGRFGSPLWISLHKTGGSFTAVYTLFSTAPALKEGEVHAEKGQALFSNLIGLGAQELTA